MNETHVLQEPNKHTVLFVEDEDSLRRAYVRYLEATPFRALSASSGQEALSIIRNEPISVVLSDIRMPNMDGIELLQLIHKLEPELPVVLLTGDPTIDTAIPAVEHRAFRYLIKPIQKKKLLEVISQATTLYEIARLKKEVAAYLATQDSQSPKAQELHSQLDRGIEQLWMAYQPIVDPRTQQIHAYEALARTREETIPHPGVLFSIAEQLERVHELGRAIRTKIGETLHRQKIAQDIYINLHPSDLFDETLFSPDAPLAPFASHIVLEITERAALNTNTDIPNRIHRLRELGYRIAIDDLGAGYSGLSYFTLLKPDVVKLDITLVRNIHMEKIKLKLVGSITSLCKDLKMRVIAEGIESAQERDAILELGCDLFQGFFFARPAPAFPSVAWES